MLGKISDNHLHFIKITSIFSSTCLILLQNGVRHWPISSAVKHANIGAVGLGFDFWAGQIGHSVANSSLPLQHFFGTALPKC